MKKIIPIVGTVIFLVLLITGSSYWSDTMKKKNVPEYVFTYAENQSEGYPTTEAAHYFSDLVYERSEGRIKINIHASGVLGNETAVIEQLRYGGLDFARVSLMAVADFVPKMGVLQLPYLYQDAEHMWNVLNGEIGQELIEVLEDYGIKGLSWYDAGTRNLYTIQKIIRLEDLEGKQIRVAKSQLMENLIRSFGATPVFLDYGEIYSGLELGVVDGAENNWPSYVSSDHHKVASYVLLDEHNRIPELQLVSEVIWDKLSKEDQHIIEESAKESAVYQRKLWEQQEKESREIAEREGVITTELSEAEKERFRQATLPINEEYAVGYEELLQRIESYRY